MRSTPLRRRIAYGVLSTGVLAGVLAPLTASAAPACPTYAGPPEDSVPANAALAPVLQHERLDIVSPGVTSDTAAGTEKSSYVLGDFCGPVAAPSAGGPTASPAPTARATPRPTATPGGSASPTPTGPPEPAVPVPAQGCLGFADEVGDSNAAVGPAGFGDDPDLDLVSVTGNTTATTLSGHLGVAELGTAPSRPGFSGHRFEYQFTLGEKTVVLRADGTGPGTGTVDGTAQSDLAVTAVFDLPSSQVVLNVDRAGLAKVVKTSVREGTVLRDVTGRSVARTPATATVADTATAEDPVRARYTVGDDVCFAPALSVTVPVQVQTSDLALVNVAVTTSDGRVARDQKVIARIGDGRAVSVTTDDSGTASLFVPVVEAAGSRRLTIRSTGSAGEGWYQTPVRVLIERTVLMVRSTGSGPTRTLTATLSDDDTPRRALTGQRLVFSFANRTVAATTDRTGRASVQVPADTFVDVTYAGRSGFLTPSSFRISS